MIEFIFPYRLHRLAYLVRVLATNFVTYFLYSCSTTTDSRIWWASFIILTFYALFFIVLPRIRDIGMSGWWLLLTLVPIADGVFGIILLFRAPALLSHKTNAAREAAGSSMDQH